RIDLRSFDSPAPSKNNEAPSTPSLFLRPFDCLDSKQRRIPTCPQQARAGDVDGADGAVGAGPLVEQLARDGGQRLVEGRRLRERGGPRLDAAVDVTQA